MPPLRFALLVAFVIATAAATVGLGWLLGQMLGFPVLGVGLAVPPLLILLVAARGLLLARERGGRE